MDHDGQLLHKNNENELTVTLTTRMQQCCSLKNSQIVKLQTFTKAGVIFSNCVVLAGYQWYNKLTVSIRIHWMDKLYQAHWAKQAAVLNGSCWSIATLKIVKIHLH